MRIVNIIGAAVLLTAGLNAETFNTDTTVCCLWGAGNVNGHWDVTVTDGIEIGLRGAIRQVGPVDPGAGDNYFVPTGTQPGNPNRVAWNWEFSVDLTNSTAGKTFGPGGTAHTLLTITDSLHSSSNSFDLLLIPDNGKIGGNLGIQNSENFAFTAIGLPGFNPNDEDVYTFKLDVLNNGDNAVLATDQMTIDTTPEPATWSMIGLGLTAVAALRRKRKV